MGSAVEEAGGGGGYRMMGFGPDDKMLALLCVRACADELSDKKG